MQLQTSSEIDLTITHRTAPLDNAACAELMQWYESLIAENRFHWTTHLHFRRRIGSGGQGVVFLTEKKGADGFTVPVALKIFSPERYANPDQYYEDMGRMGVVAAQVARIQHDYLVGVDNFLERNRIRLMVMEWVEGFDLRRLLAPGMLGVLRDRVSAPPLAIHERRHRHYRRFANAFQIWRRSRNRAALPVCAGGAASARDCSRGRETGQYHAQT